MHDRELYRQIPGIEAPWTFPRKRHRAENAKSRQRHRNFTLHHHSRAAPGHMDHQMGFDVMIQRE